MTDTESGERDNDEETVQIHLKSWWFTPDLFAESRKAQLKVHVELPASVDKIVDMETIPLGLASWERTLKAAELVKQRLLRVTAALDRAGVPYAVIGGNAVAAWVGKVDQSAVRFTQNVDLLIRRSDFDAVSAALEIAGFLFRHGAGIDMFIDGPEARARDAIHVIYAGEKVRSDYAFEAPDVVDSEVTESFRVLSLDALVRMKLTSFRDKDRTHLRDLIGVGLIDESWIAKLPDELASRLRLLIETPDG